MRRCLIFGCGYLGRRVAERWLAAGHSVTAVTRSPEKAAELRRLDISAVVGDLSTRGGLPQLPQADWVLYSVGFDGKGLRDEVAASGLRRGLDALPEAPEKIVYISSTGVYGQDTGQWVDEDSPCHPAGESGRACLDAERALADHRFGSRAVVLRLAGLYGPGRLPRVDALRRGEPIPVRPESWLNLVHVDDAARAVEAAAERARPPATYLVSDGHPALRREYYEYLATLIGAPGPVLAEIEPSAPRGRGDTSKRVDPGRFGRELGWAPRYASFREGLRRELGDQALDATAET